MFFWGLIFKWWAGCNSKQHGKSQKRSLTSERFRGGRRESPAPLPDLEEKVDSYKSKKNIPGTLCRLKSLYFDGLIIEKTPKLFCSTPLRKDRLVLSSLCCFFSGRMFLMFRAVEMRIAGDVFKSAPRTPLLSSGRSWLVAGEHMRSSHNTLKMHNPDYERANLPARNPNRHLESSPPLPAALTCFQLSLTLHSGSTNYQFLFHQCPVIV